MVNLKDETILAIKEHLPADSGITEVVEYLFKKDLIDTKRCRYALIKRFYFDLLKDNPDLKNIDAQQITADSFNISTSQVEKSIYYYTKVEI